MDLPEYERGLIGMNSKKILSLALASTLALSAGAAFADWGEAEYEAAAKICTEFGEDYTGKTVILHSNDVHGQVDGYAYIAALGDKFESLGAEVLLADVGDFSQGTTYVSASKGATAVELMNVAGYDIITLGNHEFDFGYSQLMENLSEAEFKTVCCNVIVDETGEPILPGTEIIETAGGLKLGFVGIETPETATKVNPGLITSIHFTAFDELYTTVQAAVDSIRDKADLVIALAHLGVDEESKQNGYRSLDLVAKVNGIDFTLDGHSHTVMTAGEGGEKIQSTGTKFAYVGVVIIDNATKTIEDNYVMPTKLNGYYVMAQKAEVAAKAAEIIQTVDWLYGDVFATSEVLLTGDKAPGNRTMETNNGDLICDAMVWSVLRAGGVMNVDDTQVVGITNGGGIRAAIKPGDVTMKDINTVLPFGNTVAVVYVTGNELLEALEASTFCTPDSVGGYPQTSGIKWTLDTTKAFDQGDVYVLNGKESSYYAPKTIQRVTIESINGQPFDPEATYAVVTNNFCAAGGDTYNVFGRSENSFDTSLPMDEAVMDYITDVLNGVITEAAYGAPRGDATQILPAAE